MLEENLPGGLVARRRKRGEYRVSLGRTILGEVRARWRKTFRYSQKNRWEPHFRGHWISDQGVHRVCVVCFPYEMIRVVKQSYDSTCQAWKTNSIPTFQIFVAYLDIFFFLLALSRWAIWYTVTVVCWHIPLHCSLWQRYYWPHFSDFYPSSLEGLLDWVILLPLPDLSVEEQIGKRKRR